MTTTDEVRQALTEISNVLGDAVTSAQGSEDPFATITGQIDQIRGFVNAMALTVTDIEPDPNATVHNRPGALLCASCIQNARDAEAAGRMPLPIYPASTVVQGIALCDVEGRHRIVTAVQHAVAQRSSLILPGQQPMPGQN